MVPKIQDHKKTGPYWLPKAYLKPKGAKTMIKGSKMD